MLEYPLALGAYEKRVILELDKRLTLQEARVFYYRAGARILLSTISNYWELKKSVDDCVHALQAIGLLLFRGYVPTPDAIAYQLTKLKLKATAQP